MRRNRTLSRGGLRTERGDGDQDLSRAQPRLGQHDVETQAFGTINRMPIGLDEEVRQTSVELLNPLLADTMTLRDLYKKHHWQVAGPTFYQLHLLFDKHFQEQQELVDELAERIMMLGGISVAMPHDVVEVTRIERPPIGREDPPTQISRLLEAHELILREAHRIAREAADRGDDGTNDLVVSDVIRTNEMQAWFLSEHLVETPLTQTEES
jgi:starvation-inducible DNA-binding protein